MRITIVTLLPLLLFIACEGPEGPVGPQGNQGAQGPPGAANVQAVTFTLSSSGFSGDRGVEEFQRSMSALTSDIIEDGVVLAYTDLGNNAFWYALPLTIVANGTTVSQTYAFRDGSFSFLALSDPASFIASTFDGHHIRVVLIPPSQAASKTSLDYSRYLDVARYYGLPLD